jgi:ubiquitin-conjugating enzyme E2 J2
MTSEEMTTGSVGATEAERKWAAGRSRWWNSTGGGSSTRVIPGVSQKGNGAIKAGDGGAKFRAQWPELDRENWKWMEENKIDPATGERIREPGSPNCSPQAAALGRRPSGSGATIGAVVGGGQAARNAGQSWLRRNKLLVAGAVIFTYVLIARILGEGGTTTSST